MSQAIMPTFLTEDEYFESELCLTAFSHKQVWLSADGYEGEVSHRLNRDQARALACWLNEWLEIGVVDGRESD